MDSDLPEFLKNKTEDCGAIEADDVPKGKRDEGVIVFGDDPAGEFIP